MFARLALGQRALEGGDRHAANSNPNKYRDEERLIPNRTTAIENSFAGLQGTVRVTLLRAEHRIIPKEVRRCSRILGFREQGADSIIGIMDGSASARHVSQTPD